ncbi:hypothetical protein Y1Q_0013503 [Alligator mississippiensis]|uniref:Uncharacterized protein n=1 Tax=Alligator mississippiensis TaxID=8496 RepID=A0A151P2Z1_ALLMI|nr:hypothetical protein Y1Q_0013503 [Alligator mississippiensis]
MADVTAHFDDQIWEWRYVIPDYSSLFTDGIFQKKRGEAVFEEARNVPASAGVLGSLELLWQRSHWP